MSANAAALQPPRPSPAVVSHLATMSVLYQDGDYFGAVRCAREALAAAGDPLRALLAAAALVDVDRPMPPAAARTWRCGWCQREVPGRRRGNQLYCGQTCFRDHRREFWRLRGRERRAAARAAS